MCHNHNRLCIMRQSFPPLSPLLLPNSGHRLVDNYHDMFLGPIALSSETYFISQQENKDTGGGGNGAQYFIGLHFDEIASGCPAGELWARRPARKNNGLPTVHSKLFQRIFLWFKKFVFLSFPSAHFSVSDIPISLFLLVAYFSVSETFMRSTAAALITIYMICVGGSNRI